MKVNSVFVVYLQFEGRHLASAQDVMKKKVIAKLSSKHLVWITIDNAVSQDVEIVNDPSSYFISGDNSSREFSGFDKGVEFLKRLKPRHDDLVIFANDTFHRSYGDAYLDSITDDKINKMQSENGILGYVDSFPNVVTGFNRTFSRWVRTSFLMLDYSILDRVLPFAILADKKSIFGSTTNEFFVKNEVLSENYRQYIQTWLFQTPDEKNEFKESWHSKECLTDKNIQAMQEKAWCILCEQQFSARADELGIPIIKIND